MEPVAAMPIPAPHHPAANEEPVPVRILVVGHEAEPGAAADVLRWAADAGAEAVRAPDPPHAVRQLAAGGWDVLVAVLGERPDEDLTWWTDVLRGAAGAPRLIVAARRPSLGLALRAERVGVLELLSLPLQRDDFRRSLGRVQSAAAEVPRPLPEAAPEMLGQYALVGQSPAMLETYKLIARVAPSTATVLLQGDSGTGKEVVARAIHANGPRSTGPFVAVNCAAIPENLLESELFGHERGAFTGAVTRRLGRFEQAAGGTLFLDEIADMSLALQAKILRAVQEREVERVGGAETIAVDVRLIAATNRDLKSAIARGAFREDLYFRLAVVTIALPPLDQRDGDLLLLTAHFIRTFGERYGKRISAVSDRALALLEGHRWVGNVRELRNVVERAVIVAGGEVLRAEHLPDDFRGEEAAVHEGADGGVLSLAQVEARHIARVLAHTNGQISQAAELLGIHRNTLARKIREYGL